MGLKDFFKAVREKKFSEKQASLTATNGLSDEEIAANWIKCKSCNATIYKADYEKNLNVCTDCGSHGRISAWQRIDLLVDDKSFNEINQGLAPNDPLSFVDDKPYTQTLASAQKKTNQLEAIITGFASIEGTNIALAVMNFDFLGGSMGSVVGEKLTRLIEEAINKKLPVICVSSSGGARMHEGILSLMQMAKTSIALNKLEKARLPFFSILTDPTYGGVSASFATLGDLIIAEPGARVGFAGRRVIEETVREKLPNDFQTAEYLLEHGQVDLIIKRHDMKSKLARLLRIHGFMPKNFQAPDKANSFNTQKANIAAPKKDFVLDFEKPLIKIQEEIKSLEKKIENPQDQALLNKLKHQYKEVEESIYRNLSPIDITKIARHPNRPNVTDYLDMICGQNNWTELHGDRAGTDDAAIFTGLAELDGMPCVVVGTRKGRNLKENQKCNFGMPQPEGYRKARRLFTHANKFNLPIVTFIDTPGAYPGLNAEANGQSIAIAENLKTLADMQVPVIAIVTGEGGSGGALAIGVANKVLMLENSVYSVISPEGCAAILWRTRDKAAEAASALKITAKDLHKLKIADEIIAEPFGGAHRDWLFTANNIREALVKNLQQLTKQDAEKLYQQRVEKFYAFGQFSEAVAK